MDPYAIAAGFSGPAAPPRVKKSAGEPPAGSAVLSPQEQAQSDSIERSPGVAAELQGAIARATPAQRAILTDPNQNGMALVKPTGPTPNDPYASAAGFGPGAAAAPAAPVAAPVAAAPDAPRLSLGPMDDATNFIARAGANAGNSIYGGLKGLATLATGGGVDAAADAARSAPIPVVAPTQGTAQLERGVGMIQAPLDKLGDWAQLGTEDSGVAGAGPMGAIAKAGLSQLPLLLGAGGRARSGAETTMEEAFRRAKGMPERIEPNFAPNPGVDVKFNSTPVDNSPAGLARDGFTPVQKTLADASPELQNAVSAAQSAGKPISQDVLSRHVAADTLPVPVKLTEGQATMSPSLISEEMNGRGKSQPAVSPDFYNAQGKALASNIDAIQAKVAPDIADTGKTTLGQTVVDAYKAKDAPIVADISAKYKALADANGGALPIDGAAFVQNTDAALSKALKTGSVPADLAGALNEFRNGRPMTFEDFETLRSDAADAMRSSSDGRARAAAGIIRQQLENMPLTPEAAALKPLADAARSAAKARFDALETDPAYKAAVNDSTPAGEPSPLADRFTDGYVINGRHANVRQMRANLADDPTANQAIAAAQLEHLRSLAKADPLTGHFSQDGWNKGIKAAGPKLAEILGPEAQTVQALGDTAKLVQAQPRGAYVNNSNTVPALASEGAKLIAEHGANWASLGLGAPPILGSIVRKVGSRVMDNQAAGRAAKRATEPGAGLTRLSDVGKK